MFFRADLTPQKVGVLAETSFNLDIEGLKAAPGIVRADYLKSGNQILGLHILTYVCGEIDGSEIARMKSYRKVVSREVVPQRAFSNMPFRCRRVSIF